MKNLKNTFQIAFMLLLLIGVFGIYSELRDLNKLTEARISSSNQASKANYPVVRFSSLDVGAVGGIPTVTFTNYGSDKDYKAVPVVIMNDTNYTWD